MASSREVTSSKSKKRVLSSPGVGVSTHKAYQSVLPCGNKFLQRKWDQTYYDEHRRLVRSAKPLVDTSAPKLRPHVTSKLKKQQLEKERSDEIDKDNLTLLKKMRLIMKTEGQVDAKYKYEHHSLNEKQRLLEMERIARENKAMLKRLEEVEPTYKVSEWIEEWRQREELVQRITSFPERTRVPTALGQSRGMASPMKQKNLRVEGAITDTKEPEVAIDNPKDTIRNTDS